MKIFKRVYYPVMAVLVVLMLVLGIVDAHVGGGAKAGDAYAYATAISQAGTNDTRTHNSYDAAAQQNVRNYIVNTLKDAGARLVESENTDDDGNNLVDYAQENGAAVPTLYVQKATVTQASQAKEDEAAVAREVQNIILAVPGTSDDAILLHARYDSTVLGGAADAAATGALLQNAVRTLTEGKTYKNTVVFLFGDAGQEGDLGACAFVGQFAGFDNVAKKVRAAADFSAGGTDGTLMMYAGKGNLKLVGKYAGFNGGTYASSALKLFADRSDYATSGVFGDYNTLTFTNRGGFNRYGTANDTTVNKKLVGQQSNAMGKFVSCYADASVRDLDSKSSAVYFSYLDVMTVYYPAAIAFVIAGIIVGLMIAIVILNMRNKAFPWGKALAGAAVQVVTLLATALVTVALYYVFALLLSGFGVLPFHGLSSIKFASTGLLLAASVMAITVAVFFYILLKRTFAVKAADVVRGNALVFAAVAVVLSFAAPAISYPFTCVALFALVAMLMTVLFKQKFKQKFATDIERLFLYVWPIVFALPLIMPLMYAAQTFFPAVSLVLALAVMVGLGGFIAPYADYLKPVFDKVFKKLPARSLRHEYMATERVEDRAKKGKFTEVQVKKIEKEKVPWNYLNRIGLTFTAVVSAVLIMLFCSFSTTYSSSALAAPSYYNGIYDDALLFVYEKDGSGTGTATVEVHDLIAYNDIRYAVKDLSWNGEKRAYTKNYNRSVDSVLSIEPAISENSGVVSFTSLEWESSQVVITLKNATSVTKVQFNADDENTKTEEYEFEEQEEITLRLPYGYMLKDMKLSAESGTPTCDIRFEQHVYKSNNLFTGGTDWDAALERVSNLRSGIVIKLSHTM